MDCPPTPPGISFAKRRNSLSPELSKSELGISQLLLFWFKAMERTSVLKLAGGFFQDHCHMVYVIAKATY
jgi:hypothetical protein